MSAACRQPRRSRLNTERILTSLRLLGPVLLLQAGAASGERVSSKILGAAYNDTVAAELASQARKLNNQKVMA